MRKQKTLFLIILALAAGYVCRSQVPAPCLPPVVDFSFSETACDPLQIEFTANIQSGYSYRWTINGANYLPPDPTNPAFTYTFPGFGKYPVVLTVTSGACSASVKKNVAIRILPAELIANHDTAICLGTSIPIRTRSLVDACWSPSTYLDNPSSVTPNATPPVTTTYHLTAIITGSNLVTNGDFESGNTGFTSGYQYADLNKTEGQYVIGTNAQVWHGGGGMDPCPDHTKGTGKMMIVNGAPEAGVSVWTSEPMTVAPNTNYAFSVWIESVDDLSPASLQFSINGSPLGNPINASATSCNWSQFYTIWNSGDNGTAIISLINNNTIRFGNDFALDDISFAPMMIQSDSLVITVDSLPRITAGKSNDIDCSVHFTRLIANGGISYSWTPDDGVDNPFSANPTASVDHTTLFTVRGAGSNGCIGADSITVEVTATGANTFLVPNAFSPNADGRNDCFGIEHWGNVQLEQMQIFNRGGVLVFATRDPSRCWDGTFRGKPQPAGAYAYIIKAHTSCGEITRKGVVTLLR